MVGLLAMLGMGCLPHGALGSSDALTPSLWSIETEGRRHVLSRQFVRGFRDGSNGWLFCLQGTASCAELRAFADGTVLTLEGLDRFDETARADLIAVWPIVSPRVSEAVDLLSSWPLGHDGRLEVRIGAKGGWRQKGGALRWRAALGEGGSYDAGELDASVEIDSGGTKAASWELRYERCAAGGRCTSIHRSGRLARLSETAAPLPVAPCPNAPDPARAPLCLMDGTPIADHPAAAGALTFGLSDSLPPEP